MKFSLADGTVAFLNGIVQTGKYHRDYKELPPDAVEEVKRLATLHLPESCWRAAPMLLIGVDPESLNDLMRRKRLPRVMCVAEFVSYRDPSGKLSKPVFLNIVWLQNDFLPYFSPENEAAFRQIEWDKYSVGRKAPAP